MRLLHAFLAFWHACRAQKHSSAYARHMDYRAYHLAQARNRARRVI